MEQRLRVSEDRARVIFDRVRDGILIHDPKTGRFLEVNQRACEMFGYSREEFLALEMSALSLDHDELADHTKRAMSGESVMFEWLCKTKDHHAFWVEVSMGLADIADRLSMISTLRDITERRIEEQARERLAAIVDSSNDAILGETLDGTIISWNQGAERMYGYEASEAIGRSVHFLAPDAGHEDLTRRLASVARGMRGESLDIVRVRKDGTHVNVAVSISPIRNDMGEIVGISSIGRDVSETKRALAELAYQDRLLRAVTTCATEILKVSSLDEGMLECMRVAGECLDVHRVFAIQERPDATEPYSVRYAWRAPGLESRRNKVSIEDWMVSAAMSAWRVLLGRRETVSAQASTSVGAVRTLLAGLDLSSLLLAPIFVGETFWGTFGIGSRLAERAWTAVEVETLKMLGDVTGAVIARERADRHLMKIARIDSLTGLDNRAAFVEALDEAIAKAHGPTGGFAMFYLDLDHFKDVNDTLGHPVGDLMIKEAARRLQATIGDVGALARFGGDEFGVIGWNIPDEAAAAALADKLVKSMAEPFRVGTHEIRTTTSIGVVLHGPEAPTSEAMLSNSDIALYRAKAEGRGGYKFFTRAMDDETRKRVTLGTEIRAALDREEMFLLYQPQVDARTRRIIGVEALVRWNHPSRGLVGPGEFIGAAERAGLIGGLGQWVMRQSCRQARAWLDAGVNPGLVSINLSSLQFRANLEADLAEILFETDLPASMIELEITETVLMDASREHSDLLIRLKDMGFRIAIDDFGTGYSSLDYLTRFPIDRIKIAQNFVMDLSKGSGNKAVVKAAIGLALALNVEVIAEGVETAEQLAWLEAEGCHQVQGFYFSKPVTAARFEALLRSGPIVVEPVAA
jgi:diguanylate cyclase (GGDEF)-like protein/PAS domain S-box-containing protein